MPHLKYLSLQGTSQDAEVLWNDHPGSSTGFMSAKELKALLHACPALNTLHVCNPLQTGSDASSLVLRLPARVTDLSVGGPAFDDDAAEMISRHRQLQRLCWQVSPDLTDAGLQQLTALRSLQHLHIFQVHSD
jgi:hypothetical protein